MNKKRNYKNRLIAILLFTVCIFITCCKSNQEKTTAQYIENAYNQSNQNKNKSKYHKREKSKAKTKIVKFYHLPKNNKKWWLKNKRDTKRVSEKEIVVYKKFPYDTENRFPNEIGVDLGNWEWSLIPGAPKYGPIRGKSKNHKTEKISREKKETKKKIYKKKTHKTKKRLLPIINNFFNGLYCKTLFTDKYIKKEQNEHIIDVPWNRLKSPAKKKFSEIVARDSTVSVKHWFDYWIKTQNNNGDDEEYRFENNTKIHLFLLSIRLAKDIYVSPKFTTGLRFWNSSGVNTNGDWEATNEFWGIGGGFNFAVTKYLFFFDADLIFGKNKNEQYSEPNPDKVWQKDDLLIFHCQIEKYFCHYDKNQILSLRNIQLDYFFTWKTKRSKINFKGNPYEPYRFSMEFSSHFINFLEIKNSILVGGIRWGYEYQKGENSYGTTPGFIISFINSNWIFKTGFSYRFFIKQGQDDKRLNRWYFFIEIEIPNLVKFF